MCRAQPASPAIAIALAIGATSAATGREAAKSAIAVRPAASARRPSSRTITALSACTATGRPSTAARHIPSYSVRSSQAGKSSMPLSAMNALKPTTPQAASSSICSMLPGTSPPQNAKSTCAEPRAAASLASNAPASIVGGSEFSGMSTRAREAAGRERARAAAAALPGGAAGVVEVHVRVDQARQDVETARVDDLVRVVAEHARLLASRDHAVGHRQVGALGADDRVEGHAALLR